MKGGPSDRTESDQLSCRDDWSNRTVSQLRKAVLLFINCGKQFCCSLLVSRWRIELTLKSTLWYTHNAQGPGTTEASSRFLLIANCYLPTAL